MRATFVKHENGDVELQGGVWPVWMHMDPMLLTQADPRILHVDQGHVRFHCANGDARYVISGVISLGGWPVLMLDRVGD